MSLEDLARAHNTIDWLRFGGDDFNYENPIVSDFICLLHLATIISSIQFGYVYFLKFDCQS
jgi:hypothetical protein